MKEMKDSGVKWIENIPLYFDINKIKYCISKRYGGCWGDDPSEDNSHLCIRIADFDFNTQSIKTSASTMRSYTDKQLSNGMLVDGDIIIEKSGGGEKTPVGRSVIYDATKHPNAMFANFCDVIRPTNIIYNRYLAYCLKAFYQNVDMHLFFNQTTGLQNLNMNKFLNAKIPFPKQEIQKRIVDFLDSKCSEIDALSADIQKEIETLEEYKNSVIIEAVTKGLDKNVPMKDSGIKWAPSIAESFTTKRLKYLLFDRNEKNNPIITDNILSLTAKQGVIPLAEKEGGGNKPKEDFSLYRVTRPGDIVMNCMNVISGSVAISDYFGCLSPVYYTFRTINPEDEERYFNYIFQTTQFQRSLVGFANGILIKESSNGKLNTIRLRVSTNMLGSLFVPYTSPKNQKLIVDFLDSKCSEIDAVIKEKHNQVDILAEYKKSIIYEYVTGKREVPYES